MTTDPDPVEGLPPVDNALVERIARTMLPHLWHQDGKPRTASYDVEVQDEARWWVRNSIGWALHFGAIRHGSITGDDVAADTLHLIREALAARGHWEAVAAVTELERVDPTGAPLVEAPTGSMTAVPDPLAGRRARRDWEREQG